MPGGPVTSIETGGAGDLGVWPPRLSGCVWREAEDGVPGSGFCADLVDPISSDCFFVARSGPAAAALPLPLPFVRVRSLADGSGLDSVHLQNVSTMIV